MKIKNRIKTVKIFGWTLIRTGNFEHLKNQNNRLRKFLYSGTIEGLDELSKDELELIKQNFNNDLEVINIRLNKLN